MSTSTEPSHEVSQFDLEGAAGQGGIGEASRAYFEKIKGGDLGLPPAAAAVAGVGETA